MSIDCTSSVWDHANPEPPIPRSPNHPIIVFEKKHPTPNPYRRWAFAAAPSPAHEDPPPQEPPPQEAG
jgi:hypothetical protein